MEGEWPADAPLPPLAERRHALVHEEGGVERALGIVLVRVGGPEHGHDRVPDELLDEAVVALDRSRQLPEQIGLKRANLLRVQGLGERGEPRQVREQDGDQPPVALGLAIAGRAGAGERAVARGGRRRRRRVARRWARVRELSPALRAESEIGLDGGPAPRAGHRAS